MVKWIHLCVICIPLYGTFLGILIIFDYVWWEFSFCKMKFLALEEEFLWSLWEFYIFKEEKLGADILNHLKFLFWICIYKIYISFIMCL